MTLKGVPAFTMIALIGLAVQAEAQTPCPEYLRLRNATTEAWKQAMRAPRSERCGALYHASLAAEATLKYADNNRESCNIKGTTARRYRLASMLVLDALFDHIQQISSNVEISKSVLLRTLVAASGAKTAAFGVSSFVPKWRARRDSNS
jgi:hypothetical protein